MHSYVYRANTLRITWFKNAQNNPKLPNQMTKYNHRCQVWA